MPVGELSLDGEDQTVADCTAWNAGRAFGVGTRGVNARILRCRAEDIAYAPSKAAVNNLTHSLAIEWGTRGIRVNGIAPAFTRTALAAPFLDDPDNREWVLSRIPMKRVGELVDFMGPAIFLASDASSFVNGHILMVDGEPVPVNQTLTALVETLQNHY